MKILWLSWKDHDHPAAGGAELVKSELCKRLAADGHEVIVLTARYKGSTAKSNHQGYKIVRVGSRFSIYWHAYRYYKKHLSDWPDLVIDECNTIPFFAKFYTKKPNIMFVHQLARQIWFYEMPLPISIIGYLLEPIYLRLHSGQKVITISNSTKQNLMRFGFKAKNISIISEGITLTPVKSLNIKKFSQPTLLSLGAIRSMKRTMHQVKAFELAKQNIPNLKLIIAGDYSGRYGQKVVKYAKASKYVADISLEGRVTSERRLELLQKAHLLIASSVKEGWGLVITEAASQGTPSVAYNIDGYRDAIENGKIGTLVKPKIEALATGINLAFKKGNYKTKQLKAWNISKQITFENSYKEFLKVAKKIEIKKTDSNKIFMRHNAIYWSASLLVSFLNYLFYPVLGRLLNPTEFGETQTIISLLTQTGALFQVLGLVSIGIATKYTDEKKRNKIIDEVSRLAFIISILFLAVSVIFSSQLVKFFHFNSTVPFYLLGVSLLIGVPASFASAYLQGKNRFKALSSINIILSISKLILSVVFVLMGLKTIGAVGGLVCAQLVALLYALKLGKGLKQFVSTHISIEKLELHVLKPELPYAFMVFTTSLTSNLLLSFDILVVKHYFKPAEAGLYTGISIISNIIIYISGPFAAVMIPSIKSGQSSNRNYQILLRSMLITASVGGGALLLFLFFPHLIVSILLGDKYSPYYSFLRGLSISMFLLSISNLLIYFHIGLRHFLVAPTVILGLITTIGLLMQNHSSMNAVVQDLVTGSLVLTVLLFGLLFFYRSGSKLNKYV